MKNGVDLLTDEFYHEADTIGCNNLDFLKPGSLTKLDDNHFGSLFTLDPCFTLKLSIQYQWVSDTRIDDGREAFSIETLSAGIPSVFHKG